MNEHLPNHDNEDTQDFDWVIAEAQHEPVETILDPPLSETAVVSMSYLARARNVGREVFEVVRLLFDGEAH